MGLTSSGFFICERRSVQSPEHKTHSGNPLPIDFVSTSKGLYEPISEAHLFEVLQHSFHLRNVSFKSAQHYFL